MRVNVTGTNKDGQATASSKVTAVISGTSAPVNTARPTVSGTPQPGEELTAATGTWSNGVRTYAFQWQRCDAAGANCNDVTGATGRTYGVRAADIGGTIRVSVTATNLVGSNTATSDRTEVVKTGTPPPTTTPRRTTARRSRSSAFASSARGSTSASGSATTRGGTWRSPSVT